MANLLHIVAGIPGTRVRRSLDRLVAHLSPNGRPDESIVKWVSVEDKLRLIARPYVERIFPSVAQSSLSVLLLPRPFLRGLWLDAFNQAWREVESNLVHRNVILTLHLCYFHHLTREFFAPIDF